MDNFKIRSIDEFDFDFVAKLNENKNNEIESVSTNGPITEIAKDNSAENNFTYFNPQEQNEVPNETPLSPAQPVAPSAIYTPDEPMVETAKPQKEKQSGGAIAGKIISVILLAATIVVFVLGCFVTIFLDNHGSDLFGYTFNTVSSDTYDSKGTHVVSKGDLIIAKKADASEYLPGELVAVKSDYIGENYYSDVHVITFVNSVYESDAEITTVNLAESGMGTETISSNDTYGIVKSKITALGTILHFAMDNAILVCVMFVLLAAMWCLVLVLIENKKVKTNKQ